MSKFSLPANSKVRKDGRVFKAPAGAKNVRVFKIYRFDPDCRAESAPRHLRNRYGRLRSDGSRRPDQDQERDRYRSELSPLLPRGHLRIVRHEHRRQERSRLHQRLRRRQGRGQDLSAAAHAGDQGSGPGPRPTSMPSTPRSSPGCRPARPRRPTASGCSPRRIRRRSTGLPPASCAPAARPAARATGGTATATSGPAALLAAYRWIVDSRDEATGERLDQLRGSVSPVSLPHHHELHRGLPEGPESGQGDRRDQADLGAARALIERSADGPGRITRARETALALPPRHERARRVADPLRRGAVLRRSGRRTKRPSGRCWRPPITEIYGYLPGQEPPADRPAVVPDRANHRKGVSPTDIAPERGC